MSRLDWIKGLEKNCHNDDSKNLAEAVETPAFQDLHNQPYENEKNTDGWQSFGAYLLWFAVINGAIACVNVILRVVKVDGKDKRQWTVLHHAAVKNHSDIARVLIGVGANVNAKDSFGQSPIHRAAGYGSVQTLAMLCASKDAHIDMQDQIGDTPLHDAVYKHETECVRKLLEFGARTDIGDRDLVTPRDWAVKWGFKDIVDLFDKAVAGTAAAEVTHAPSQAQLDSTALGTMKLPVGVAYERAIKQGGIFPIKQVRVTGYGDCGVGKTCFFLAMQDQPHPDEQVSTEGVALSSVVCLVEADSSSWEMVENSTKVAEYVQQMVASHAPTPSATQSVSSPGPSRKDTRATANLSAKPAQKQLSATHKHTLSKLMEDVVSRVTSSSYVAGLKENVERGSFHLIRICDMAGQDMYRTLQDVLICPAFSVYTVVFDASKPIESPCSPAMMRRVWGNTPVSVAIEGQSRLDYLIDCLLKLQTVVDGDKCKVYLVGSKIDRRLGDDESVEKALEKDKKTIQQRLQTLELNHLVPDGNIFFVDNTRRTSRCPDSLPTLRHRISHDSEDLVKIPLNWLLFTIATMDLAKHLDLPWISKKEAEELAIALGSIDHREDLTELLLFQHALGYILYYPSAPDYVVVKVDLVMQAIAALIIPDGLGGIPFFPDRDRPTGDEAELYDSGVLMADLAAKIWRHCPNKEVQALLGQATESSASHRSTFYDMMQAMHITSNVGKQVVPSSGQSCTVMFLPSVADQTTPVDRSGTSHPAIAMVTDGGRYFSLPLMLKVATKCLSLYYNSSDGEVDLTAVQMRKKVFCLPWSSRDSCTTSLILTYFRTGLLLELLYIGSNDDAAHADSVSDAKHALEFVKSVLKVLLPTVKMVQKVKCPCGKPDANCTLHEKAGCNTPDCFHLVSSMILGKPPRCPYSRAPQDVSAATLCWMDWDQDGALRLQRRSEPVLPSFGKASVQRELFVRASFPAPNLPSPASDPWESTDYRGQYAQLIRSMDPDEVKTLCYTLRLISTRDLENINCERTPSAKNEAILRFVARSSSLFGKFREVLHHVNLCSEIAKHLDKIGPKRDEDEGCLEAREILNRLR